MLSVGTSCTVRAINARPELNGRRGVIVTELDEGGRVGVQVEGEAKPLSLKSTNVDVVSADESWVKLAMLGYHFVAGPSGDPCDLVLRRCMCACVQPGPGQARGRWRQQCQPRQRQ